MLKITKKNQIKNRIFVFTIILFCLFTFPSSASSDTINDLFLSGKYKIVLVALPQFMHNPGSWNTVYSDVSTISSFLGDNKIKNFIKENSLTHKSISEIAEIYDAVVYVNRPNYAYSKIILPEENYEILIETFESLGFKVRDDIPIEPHLDYSRSAIGLPYTFQVSESEAELTGRNRVIAIIDSGIDSTHQDFYNPTFLDKVIFWNDTTSEQKSCCVDDFGHGTHCASIAAGREGDCSDPPYPCNHWSGDANGDGIINLTDITQCWFAGCDSSVYPDNICTGTPDPCDDYDGYQYSCEYYGCTWSENPFKGVAPHARLKVWKVSRQIGGLPRYITEAVIDAILQAIEQDVDVISLSLGADVAATADMCTGNYYGQYNEDIYEWYLAIMDAIDNGITVVVSAGNDGPSSGTISFPACINDVIAVGATVKKDYECTNGYFGLMCSWDISYEPIDTNIDFYIILTENGEDTIWDAGWGWGGSKKGWSGQQIVFQPSHWPATIQVKVEGKNVNGHCILPDDIYWDPGTHTEAAGPYNDDEFWIWSETFDEDPNAPFIVIELFNLPITDSGSCWWHDYYTQDRIFVNIYRTDSMSNQGLVVPKSSRGPAPQGIKKPDGTSPGHDIIAARNSDSYLLENYYGCTVYNDDYISCSGTSMACPHVSGLVALLKEATSLLGTNPSVDEIRQALSKADDKVILSSNPDNIEGEGKVNAQKAIDYITDCGLYQAYDTDEGYEPKLKGTCYDYHWSGDSCVETPHPDSCSGSYVYEYEASGLECIGSWKNCEDYGTHWTCSGGRCVYSRPPPGGGGGGCTPSQCRIMAW